MSEWCSTFLSAIFVCVQSLLASMCGPKACSLCVCLRFLGFVWRARCLSPYRHFGLYIHNGGEGWFVRVDVSRGRFPCDGPGRGGTCQERSYHPVALHSSQLLTFLPSPHGLLPLLTGNWALISWRLQGFIACCMVCLSVYGPRCIRHSHRGPIP